MTTTSLTPPPISPSTLRPTTFATEMDNYLAWLNINQSEMSAILPTINTSSDAATAAAASAVSAAASAASALASPGTNATSTTSLVIAAGTVSLTIQTGKSFAVGAWVNIVLTTDVTKRMLGIVSSYNSGTGALVVIVAASDINGTGTFANWTITQSAQRTNVLTALDLSTVGPSIRPSLLCDFANSRRLDRRFTYSMASPISYYDSLGVLRYAAPNQVVFDHDPLTGVCRGIPIFQASTNFALYSEQFDNAVWTKSHATVTANATVSPDGNTTMDKIVEDSVAAIAHYVFQNFTGLTTGSVHFSFFAQKAERTRLTIGSNDGTTGLDCTFNLNTGNVDQIPSGATAWMEPLGNGRYRCHVTRAIAGTTLQVIGYLDNGTSGVASAVYNGDGTSGLYLWGAQVGNSDLDTPYIPTTSATVTRVAQTLNMLTSAFPYNAATGTLYSEYIVERDSAASIYPFAAMLTDGTGNNFMGLFSRTVDDTDHAIVVTGGTQVVDLTTSPITYGKAVKSALAYANNDFAYSADGASPALDTSGAVPAVTQVVLGGNTPGANILNGWIRKIAYYPRRLANAELTALTTQ